jgi:hypothetical protein
MLSNLETTERILRFEGTTHVMNLTVEKIGDVARMHVTFFTRDPCNPRTGLKRGNKHVFETPYDDFVAKQDEMIKHLAVANGLVNSENVLEIEDLEKGEYRGLRQAEVKVRDIRLSGLSPKGEA